MVLGSLVQIVGIIFSKPLADRFGKKAVFLAGVSVTTVATLGVFLVGPTSIGLLFWLGILWAVGWGPTVPLLWVMIADAADYSEWKTSRRATGFMYAGILFALKAGLSLGGALSAWVIDAYGYVPNVAQTPARAARDSPGRERLPGHRTRARHRVPGPLSDRQDAEPAHPGGACWTPQVLRDGAVGGRPPAGVPDPGATRRSGNGAGAGRH